MIAKNWSSPSFHLFARAHFYHVGSSESLPHPMLEALITNFSAESSIPVPDSAEQLAFFEQPPLFATLPR